MANKKKEIVYSANDKVIVKALKEHPEGLTLRGINEYIKKVLDKDVELVAGHIVAAMNHKIITPIGETNVERKVDRPVTVYHFITDEVMKDEKGKAFNYTDSERALLAAAKNMEGDFTLAELATAMNKEKLSSGSINGLVNKKHNIAKVGTRTVPTITKSSANIYALTDTVPADMLND